MGSTGTVSEMMNPKGRGRSAAACRAGKRKETLSIRRCCRSLSLGR